MSYKGIDVTFTFADKMRSVFGTIAVFALIILLTITVVFLLVISLGRLNNWLINEFGSRFGRLSLFLLGVRFENDFSEYKPDEPGVYIVNHSSTLDLFVVLAMKMHNVRFVAKKEIQYNPFFFILGRITGQIFIDRSSSEKSIQKLKSTYTRVKEDGLSVFVAPEGTRKHKEVVGPFKKGAFRMARDLDYPIIPAYIDNALLLCPGSKLITKKGKIVVKYMKPVRFTGLTEQSMEEQIEKIRGDYKEKYRETFQRENIDVSV